MKNIYKNYLKKVDKGDYTEVYSDLVGICYRLGYSDIVNSIDNNLLPAFICYSKGDNGKYYNAIKKWIKDIKSEKELLQVFNICNLGIRQSLYLDKIEDIKSKVKAKFEPNILRKIYGNLEPILYSGEYSTRYSIYDTKDLSNTIHVIKGTDIELFINPKLQRDSQEVIDKMEVFILSMVKDKKLSSEDLDNINKSAHNHYKNYIKLVDKLPEFSRDIKDAVRSVFYADSSYKAVTVIKDFTDISESKIRKKLYSYIQANKHNIKAEVTYDYTMKMVDKIVEFYKEFLTAWSEVYINYAINPKELVKSIISGDEVKLRDLSSLLVYLELIEDDITEENYEDYRILYKYIRYRIGYKDELEFVGDTSDIEMYDYSLFYTCLGIKLCLLNNNKVVVNDFKSKVDENSMLGFLKSKSAERFAELAGIVTPEEVSRKMLRGDEQACKMYSRFVTKPFIEYIHYKDSKRFEDTGKPLMGAYWVSAYVNYYFSNLQDNNIGAYVNFLSDSLLPDCMDGAYTESPLPFSLVYESDFNILFNRKYIIPAKGIVTELFGDSYYLREFDNILGEHCISVIFRDIVEKGTYGSMIINLTARTIIGFNADEMVIALVHKILECAITQDRKLLQLALQVTIKDNIGLRLYELPDSVMSVKPEIISPYYWKYRGENNKTSKLSEHSPVTSDKEIVVNAFVRRLPNGGIASKERQDLARRYCIKLENGYTIVDSFTRKSVEGSSKMSSFGDMK